MMNKKLFCILVTLSTYEFSFAETASRIRPLVRELKTGKGRRMKRRRKRKQFNEAETTTSQSKNATSTTTISFVPNVIDDDLRYNATGENSDAESTIETSKSEDRTESESNTINTRSSSSTIDEKEEVSNAPSASSKQNRSKQYRLKAGRISRGRRSRNEPQEGANIREESSKIGHSKDSKDNSSKDGGSKVGSSKDRGSRSKDGRSKKGGSKLGKGETVPSSSPMPSMSSAPSWSSTRPSILKPTRGDPPAVGGQLLSVFPSTKPSLMPSEEPSESPSILPSATPSACMKYSRPIVADSFCTGSFQGHSGSVYDMIRILSQGNDHVNFSILKEGFILDDSNLAVRPSLNNCTSSSDGNDFDGVFHGECVAGYASITLLFFPESSQQEATCGVCVPESHTEYCAYAVEIPCEPISFDCLPSSAPSTSPSSSIPSTSPSSLPS